MVVTAKCSSLVGSCYVRNFEESSKKKGVSASSSSSSAEKECDSDNGPTLKKSNLKKTTMEENQQRPITEKRKVNWPDAHGKDIAHIQEFEPSVSDDRELGVRNSCVCSVQ